jgi:hypothetical protein
VLLLLAVVLAQQLLTGDAVFATASQLRNIHNAIGTNTSTAAHGEEAAMHVSM